MGAVRERAQRVDGRRQPADLRRRGRADAGAGRVGHDWEHARPPSHPEVERAAVAPARPCRAGGRPRPRPSPARSASAPTSMVPASGSAHARRPGRRRQCRRRCRRGRRVSDPAAWPADIETVLAYVPHAPDVETVLATERRATAERAGAAPPRPDEAPTVPASLDQFPAAATEAAPGPGSSRPRAMAGAAAATLALAAGWHLVDAAGPRGPGQRRDRRERRLHRRPHRRPRTPHRRADGRSVHAGRRQSPPPRRRAAATAVAHHGDRRRADDGHGADRRRRASPHRCATAAGSAAAAPRTSAVEGDAGAGGDPALRGAGPAADRRRSRRPRQDRRPARLVRRHAAGARRRAPRRPHASRGEALRRRRRGVDRRGARRRRRRRDQRRPDPGRRRRRAPALHRRRRARPPHARRDPRSLPGQRPRAAGAADEDVDRGSDEAEGAGRRAERRGAGLAPHAAQGRAQTGGTAPVAEFALWRLGQEYRDRRLYDLAASTFADLGTRFPETRYDAWFSAAELFEKQLKDAARAREAYAKVPAASPRYEAAQKKLASA